MMRTATWILAMAALWARPAGATTFPIAPERIEAAFSTQRLETELSADLERAEKETRELKALLSRCEGYREPAPFTHAKYRQAYTVAQIEEWRRSGWVRTNEFGWPILKQKIREVLPPWLATAGRDVRAAAGGGCEAAPANLPALTRTVEEIADFIALQRHYVERTGNWDEWCRKGPWLLEDAPPGELRDEIAMLERALAGPEARARATAALYPGKAPDLVADADLRACLDAKKTVYDWYYGFAPHGTEGLAVTLTPSGYEMSVSVCLHGPGARAEAADVLKSGIETYWKGVASGIPFRAVVAASVHASAEECPAGTVKIRIGAASESSQWASGSELPMSFDPETAAHEFGHTLGFRDRYRDVYNFETGTYRTFQWDPFDIMSAQNGPNPIVSEEDLETIVKEYSK